MAFETFSLADTYGRGVKDREASEQAKLDQEYGAQRNKQAQAQTAALEEQRRAQKLIQDAARSAVDPTTGEYSITKHAQTLMQAGYPDAAQKLWSDAVASTDKGLAYIERVAPYLNAQTWGSVKQQVEESGMAPRGILPDQYDPQFVEQMYAKLKGQQQELYGGFEQVATGPDGSAVWAQREKTSGKMANLTTLKPKDVPTPSTTPVSRFETLTPEQVAAAGLPAGTSAQRDVRTGKIDVLNKPASSGANLSQKDATTARQKLNTVSLARQQLATIREKFKGIQNSASAGAFGQGKLPTEGGRAFDRAVDQMRSTLTALTRVPGVGAMSDYETKLDQAKFPSRNEYESVIADQIMQLENMLNAIETGYKDLLGGDQQPVQSGGNEPTATGPGGQKLVLRNGKWQPL